MQKKTRELPEKKTDQRFPFLKTLGPGLITGAYGIHGSPAPSKIRRQNSHGCVRVTNSDALQLAEAVHTGVKVDFLTDLSKATAKNRN